MQFSSSRQPSPSPEPQESSELGDSNHLSGTSGFLESPPAWSKLEKSQVHLGVFPSSYGSCNQIPSPPELPSRSWFWVTVCQGKWQPTPVFLPGKFHGQRNLTGYRPWGHKESDTTKHMCTHIRGCYVKNMEIEEAAITEWGWRGALVLRRSKASL